MARRGSHKAAEMPSVGRICKGCWQQMHVPVPLKGPLSLPFRMVGIRRSRMNPNTCTVCELMFTRVMKARKVTIDVSVLFADLRGYTALSRTLPPDTCSALLDAFYDETAIAIWEYDGLLNKTIGDAIMAVFNFPIKNEDHPDRAIEAAKAILRRCEARKATLVAGVPGLDGTALGIGIGIDAGEVSFGEFGQAHRDLTAIGTVVNTAARAQAAAAAGQILVTEAVRQRSPKAASRSAAQSYQLKGFEEPVELFAV